MSESEILLRPLVLQNDVLGSTHSVFLHPSTPVLGRCGGTKDTCRCNASLASVRTKFDASADSDGQSLHSIVNGIYCSIFHFGKNKMHWSTPTLRLTARTSCYASQKIRQWSAWYCKATGRTERIVEVAVGVTDKRHCLPEKKIHLSPSSIAFVLRVLQLPTRTGVLR